MATPPRSFNPDALELFFSKGMLERLANDDAFAANTSIREQIAHACRFLRNEVMVCDCSFGNSEEIADCGE
jgi:hypothetical protein